MVTAAGDAHGHSGGGRSGANYRVRWTRLDEGYLKGAAQGPKGHRKRRRRSPERSSTTALGQRRGCRGRGRRGRCPGGRGAHPEARGGVGDGGEGMTATNRCTAAGGREEGDEDGVDDVQAPSSIAWTMKKERTMRSFCPLQICSGRRQSTATSGGVISSATAMSPLGLGLGRRGKMRGGERQDVAGRPLYPPGGGPGARREQSGAGTSAAWRQ